MGADASEGRLRGYEVRLIQRLDRRRAWRQTVDYAEANYGSRAKTLVLACVANLQLGAVMLVLGLLLVILLMAANTGGALMVVPFVLAAFFGARTLYWWRRFQDLVASTKG